MRLERRETASSGWRRVSLRDTVEGAVAGLGAAIAIGAMEWLSVASHFPLVIIPFATSIVLVIGSPDAEPAQPAGTDRRARRGDLGRARNASADRSARLAAAAAVGVAIAAMVVTGTFHPPAGINPLLVVSNNLAWSFLFAPVLAGVVLLAAFAYFWHRWIRRRPWPRRWF